MYNPKIDPDTLETSLCRYGTMSYFKNDLIIGRSLHEYGEWAQGELDLLLSLLDKGNRVADVGAFIGTHTLAFAQKVGEKGKIFSFGPHCLSFELLNQNIKQNNLSNVVPYNIALSNNTGKYSFSKSDVTYKQNPGSFSLNNTDTLGQFETENKCFTIDVNTLAQTNITELNLLKIDAEGMEPKILEGAFNLIKQSKPFIYVECLSVQTGWKSIELLKDLGYLALLHNERSFNPSNFKNSQNNIFGEAIETNILFVEQSKLPLLQERYHKYNSLIIIKTIDDLVLGLLKKPQYKYEILAKTETAALYNVDFFANEPELKYFKDELLKVQAVIAQDTSEIDELLESLKTTVDLEHKLESYLDIKGWQYINFKKLIKTKDDDIALLNSTILDKGKEIDNLKLQLQRIQSGTIMKLRNRYDRTVEKLLSIRTKRLYYYDLGLRGIRVIKNEGWNSFLRKTIHWFKVYNNSRKTQSHIKMVNTIQTSALNFKTASSSNENYISYLLDHNNSQSVDYETLKCKSENKNNLKLIAFYLPQFHPIPENDIWWGKGFTEWTNVSRAVPQFIGHHQPRLPGELGFYDLRVPDIQKRQVELAKLSGIYGFCFHFYWFNGKRLLDAPLEQFVSNPDLNIKFCINWANENWSRRWDGQSNEILIKQEHSDEDDLAFIKYVSKYFKDTRYIRIDGKPLLVIYRPAEFPDPKKTAERWRSWCRSNGIGEIYLAITHSFEHLNPDKIGFDAALEFPPNSFILDDISHQFEIKNNNYQGHIYDYSQLIQLARKFVKPEYKKFRGICPSWDNEARRPGKATLLANSNPKAYKEWLEYILNYTDINFAAEEKIVFINAWNEWAEGAYLEPDKRYGYAYLNKTAEVLSMPLKGNPDIYNTVQSSKSSILNNYRILFVSHDACKAGAQSLLLNIISWFKIHTYIDIKIICLDGGEWLPRFQELADTLVLSELRKNTTSTDELIKSIESFCYGQIDLIYGNSVASGREYQLLSNLRTPIITHFHELQTSVNKYAAEYINDVLKYSSHFIACSEAVRKYLTNTYNVEETKITTVCSSIVPDISTRIINEKEKQLLKKKLGIERNKFIIFGCGTGMAFRKGADLFIDVARILRKKGLKNFHFYWIGGFSRDEKDDRLGLWSEYLASLKEDGLEKYVTFLGFKNNAREFLKSGDIFLLPSREEPFGLVILEAAEFGLPTICFADAGGALEFVQKDGGFVVPFEDTIEMAEKVNSLIQDKKLRNQLGAQARNKMLSQFNIENTTPHILSTCRNIICKKPTVSVIIPNYNHERFLTKRLDSIFSQTFKDFEVIFLDDASNDKSLELLKKYSHYPDVRIIKNDQNSGSPFKQWLKGIDNARADIIWIAESDDACDVEFLNTLLPAFQNPEVMLAYVNSHIINEQDLVIGDYIEGEYLSSLSSTKWKTSYEVTAVEEINDGLGVKDTILNASAMLFRRFELSQSFRQTFEKMRIAGDWFFEVNAIHNGKIVYKYQKLNYHRRHAQSVIATVTSEKKLEDFYHEFCVVQRYIFQNYKLLPGFLEKFEKYMHKQWNDFHPDKSITDLNKYYPMDEMRILIQKNIAERR